MFSLNDCIGFITNIASKRLSEEFNRRLESYGVTRVNWIAIYYIGDNDGISQRELANKMDVNESSIAEIIFVHSLTTVLISSGTAAAGITFGGVLREAF